MISMSIAPSARKALYQNVLLIAYADRSLGEEEGAFLETLRERAGISEAEAAAYRRELSHGDISFRPVGDREDALLIAKAAIGAASSDGEFHRSERHALLELGKAIGLTREELQALVYEYFRRDVLSELFPQTSSETPGQAHVNTADRSVEGAPILIVRDDFKELEAFVESLGPRAFELVSRRGSAHALRGASLVFFHLLEDRAASVARLHELKAGAGPDCALVFIAERQQAYQIGYLLDEGAAACLIAPIYPEEIDALLERLGR